MSAGLRTTLNVSLWDGQLRGNAANSATLAMPAARPSKVFAAVTTPRDLFVGTYAKFADACRTFDEPGLAIVAVHEQTGRAAGIVKLTARVQRPVAAIVGRHDRCDLFLQLDERLSLRQLAIVLEPVTNWQRGASNVRYRILDLRTEHAMVDEEGKQLRGLLAEGPAIVRCGGYTLFALPLGDPTDWPQSAADAWAMIPARVYLDELAEGSLPRIRMRSIERRGDLRETFITRTQGPRDTGMRLAQGDQIGHLEIYTPHRQLVLGIGRDALRDGVLLGRYGRCDMTEAAGEDTSLSRVHALLIQVEDRLLMIDTASSNGTFDRGQPIRVVVIESDTELRMGKRTFLRWRWG